METKKPISTAELREKLNGQTGKARGIIAELFDEGTFAELGAYYGGGEDFEPVVTGYGAIGGELVYVFAQDFSNRKGAVTPAHAEKICALLDKADKAGAPVIGVFDSAGAPILEGAAVLQGYGKVFQKLDEVDCTTIALVTGLCAGMSAVIAASADFTVADSENGQFYIAPPYLNAGKGGSIAEAAKRGDVQITAINQSEAIEAVKKLIGYRKNSGSDCGEAELNRRTENIEQIISSGSYDVRNVIREIADDGDFFEISENYAPEIRIGFAKIGGRVCGIVASDPEINGGVITPDGAVKAAYFVGHCDGAKIALVTLVDSEGISRECGAKADDYAGISFAYSNLYYRYEHYDVTVILGKAYGAAFSLLGSKGLGASTVLALDRASISVMAPEAAVEFAYSEEINGAKEPAEERQARIEAWKAEQASPLAAAKCGAVDDIIASDELRMRIISALEAQA